MSNASKVGSWFQRFSVAYTTTGGPSVMQEFPTAASQTITVGAPLTLNTATGEVSVATATSTEILGVAASAVTTTASDEKTIVKVWLAVASNVFIGQSDAATSGLHEGGAAAGIRVSSGKWMIDIGDDNNTDVVLVLAKVPGDDESDNTYPGRYYFIWNKVPFHSPTSA